MIPTTLKLMCGASVNHTGLTYGTFAFTAGSSHMYRFVCPDLEEIDVVGDFMMSPKVGDTQRCRLTTRGGEKRNTTVDLNLKFMQFPVKDLAHMGL